MILIVSFCHFLMQNSYELAGYFKYLCLSISRAWRGLASRLPSATNFYHLANVNTLNYSFSVGFFRVL